MSLQVWLPLNGDFHNQGLLHPCPAVNSQITGNRFTDTGKIGGSSLSYTTTLSSYTTWFVDKTNNNFISLFGLGKKYSIAGWFKIKSSANTDNNSAIFVQLGYNTSDIYPDKTYRNFGLWWTNATSGGGPRFVANNGDYGGAGSIVTSIATDYDVWHHIAYSFDNTSLTTKCVIYIDGIAVTTKTFTKTNANCNDMNTTNDNNILVLTPHKFCYNDLRIYDHLLSAKEVKEIAKGLVLWYPLNDMRVEATTNLVTTTDGLSNSCYNGATGKYSYGTTTDMYKTYGNFQGKNCTKVYMGTAGLSAYPYVYFDAFNTVGTAIHTLSFDYYPTSQGYIIPYSYNGLYNFNWTNGIKSGSSTNVSAVTIPVELNTWNHITITMQKYDTTNMSRGNGYIRIGSAAHTSTTTDYWLFANVQVEAKDHATAYAGVGGTRIPTTVYDCSGFGNNGTIVGALETTTLGPRYNHTTHFDQEQYIRVNKRPADCMPKDAITINLWQYATRWSNPISCTEGGGWNFENSSGIRFPIYISGVGYKVAQSSITPASTQNTWHMLTGTMNQDNIKFYYDGELVATTANNSTNGIGYANNYIFIAAEAAGNTTTPASSNYIGNLSDVRIYATALSDAQVQELYRTSQLVSGTTRTARDLI